MKKILMLEREDLSNYGRSCLDRSGSIALYSFDENRVPMEKMEKADIIIYSDDTNLLIVKDITGQITGPKAYDIVHSFEL